MAYIDKDALVAEFNRLIAKLVEEGENTLFEQGRISAFEDAKLFLDTIKVKEVVNDDLEEAAKECMHSIEGGDTTHKLCFIKGAHYQKKQDTVASDAFIENACSGIEKLLSGYIIRNFHFGDSYDIDRLIEDFRKYMKGE